MMEIEIFIEDLKERAEERFKNFEIKELKTISDIKNDAYLEKPTWVGGDNKFVCLYIDLDQSSKISFKKHPKTMAKIYDYFTQTIVDVFNHPIFNADYIDIKGDGAFAIYENEYASYKGFYAAITFKKIFEEKIKMKFQNDEEENLGCKIGIHKDKVLVKKIGKRGDYNEVWAGKLVNNAAKLAKEYQENPHKFANTTSPIIISEQIYADFIKRPEFGLYHCHKNGEAILEQKSPVFKEVIDFSDETLGDKYYYTDVGWCKYCADDYINQIQ